MAIKFKHAGKLALPVILMSLMAGCASVSDLEKVQKEVDELKAATQNANTTSQEARSIASEASGFSAAAVKSSEAAVGVAVQAQQSVNQSTIAIPWMRLDPATGRFYMQWVVWPSVGEYMGPPQVPASSTTKP